MNPLWALVLLGGAFAWAAGSAYARVAPLPGGSVLSAAMQMLTASVMLFVISAAKGDLGHVHASALSLTSVSSIAYLVGFGSILAYTAYGWLLRNAATPLLSTYAYVNPAVAVVLGWAFAGEHLGARELVAGARRTRLGRAHPRRAPPGAGEGRAAPAADAGARARARSRLRRPVAATQTSWSRTPHEAGTRYPNVCVTTFSAWMAGS